MVNQRLDIHSNITELDNLNPNLCVDTSTTCKPKSTNQKYRIKKQHIDPQDKDQQPTNNYFFSRRLETIDIPLKLYPTPVEELDEPNSIKGQNANLRTITNGMNKVIPPPNNGAHESNLSIKTWTIIPKTLDSTPSSSLLHNKTT